MDPLYITSSCKIDHCRVFKNAELLLDGKIDGSDWLLFVYKHFGFDYPKFYRMDSLCKLGWLAAEILLGDGYTKVYQPQDIGIVLANRSSSLGTDIKYYESTRAIASPALFVYTLPNIVMGEISIRHHLKGESVLFVSNQFEGAFIQEYVQGLLIDGSVECCICGWLEFFGDDIEADLYLVEKTMHGMSLPFTRENINKLYQLPHG